MIGIEFLTNFAAYVNCSLWRDDEKVELASAREGWVLPTLTFNIKGKKKPSCFRRAPLVR